MSVGKHVSAASGTGTAGAKSTIYIYDLHTYDTPYPPSNNHTANQQSTIFNCMNDLFAVVWWKV